MVHELWAGSWRGGLADHGPQPDLVVEHLVGRERLNDRVVAVTDPGVRHAGRVVADAQLRIDGATAAVGSVRTDEAVRGRGCGDAVLARALGLAETAGCDLVVLEATADDWPGHWYARRGFEVIGSMWAAARPA
jgi:GNAT superfamily N-acetyltransferase